VPALSDVQDKVYDEPTILLAKQVSGEEEIPENAVAVITPDAPDVLSHSSVRARNMKVLFVTCHDREPLEEMRGYVGKLLAIQTTAAGNVTWNLADKADLSNGGSAAGNGGKAKLKMSIPKWCAACVVACAPRMRLMRVCTGRSCGVCVGAGVASGR
jgi:alpha-glucan, water dikinase